MKLVIEIEMETAPFYVREDFAPHFEIARILHEYADYVYRTHFLVPFRFTDENDTLVGKVFIQTYK